MSIGNIIWIVGILAAIIFAFVSFEYAALILALLGLAGGWFVPAEHRLGLLVAAIFLMAGGAMALGSIPTLGEYLNDIFGNYGMVLAAGGLMAICLTTFERVMPGKSD